MSRDAPMSGDPLAVLDVNTIWRRKPFDSLGEIRPVLGFAPMDPLAALRTRRWPFRHDGNREIRVLMPPGWATRLASSSCRRLAKLAFSKAAGLGRGIGGFFVTSPHYLPLVEILRHRIPIYYYCSDDYAAYAGWDARKTMRAESALVRAAAHCFFVSQTLADRAVGEYGVEADKVSVSPNATDESFFRDSGTASVRRWLDEHPAVARPVVGVVGGINDRLDFELLRACAENPAVGTLLLVGPVDAALAADPAWQRLRAEKRCVAPGLRPHGELPAWMAAIDVALIPYRRTPLNRACSPMRLFDHLASGKPIVATDACEQIREFAGFVRIAESAAHYVELVADALAETRSGEDGQRQRDFARSHTWRQRAAAIHAVLPS